MRVEQASAHARRAVLRACSCDHSACAEHRPYGIDQWRACSALGNLRGVVKLVVSKRLRLQGRSATFQSRLYYIRALSRNLPALLQCSNRQPF